MQKKSANKDYLTAKEANIEVTLLTCIQRLLAVEHVLVEQLLQAFVRVVDAQLLEGINSQHFEAENVQNPNKRGGFCVRANRAAVGVIDLLDDVREQRGVYPLDQRVDIVCDVRGVQLLDVDAVPVSHLHALG